MRFIIREQPYEKPLAAGLLRYEQDGQPTGTVEHWRLNDAAEGYRFFRVDLDARDGTGGDSYLYHLLLGPDNRPERLKFRYFKAGTIISGDLLIEDDTMTLLRDVKGQHVDGQRVDGQRVDGQHVDEHFEETAETDDQTRFWYPSTMGLGILAYCHPGPGVFPTGTFPAFMLDKTADFALKRVEVAFQVGEEEKLVVAQQNVVARPLSIRWADQVRTLWLNPHRRPVKMVRGDGLTAVETRHIHY
jgi:hypothetical protein